MNHTSEFELHGFLVEVEFSHEPAEPMDTKNDYPGSHETFEITGLRIDGRNCINALCFGNVQSELVGAIKKENGKLQEA
jgi:hypothetical protein